MTQTVLDRPAVEGPDRAELQQRVDALLPLAREHAHRTERDRKVADELVHAFKDTQLHRAFQPRKYGGWERGFELMIDASATLARGCASSAWCCGLYMAHGWLAGLFPAEAQDDLWGGDPNAVMSGSYAPAGKATRVDGGYRLTGRYSFSSGSPHADWNLCAAMLPNEDGNGATPAFTLIPKTDYTIDWDSWNTVGMSGTGSYDVLLDDVFLPAHRALTFAHAANGDAPGAAANGNPFYRMAILSCVPYALSTPAVGAAMGALELFVEQNKNRETRGAVVAGGMKVCDFQTVQKRVGEAEALIDASLAIAYRDVEAVQDEARADNGPSLEMRMRNRRGQAFMAKQAQTAVDLIFDAVGGRGMQSDHPIQRAWRDVHAVNAHISLNFDAVMSMLGQYRFGLEPRGQY